MRPLAIALVAATALAASASATRTEAQSPNRLANGRLAYVLEDLDSVDGYASLVVSDPNGRRKKVILEPSDGLGVYTEPDWSPDGTRIATTFVVGSRYTGYMSEIYVANADGSGVYRPVIYPDAGRSSPAWSPDGTKLAYVQSSSVIYVVGADGLGLRRLTPGTAPAWSPDGTKIVFVRTPYDDSNLYVIGADGSGLTPLTTGPEQDLSPDWSPDGRLIVFQRGQAGLGSIYVVAPDGTGLRRLTLPRYDSAPAWSPDGTKIVFARSEDIWVMSPNGGRARNITRTRSMVRAEGSPDWQPVRVVNGAIFGTRFDDFLVGGAEHNVVNGGAGNDVIAGGRGRDVLNGGRGNDTLYAQDRQRDVIDGGPGRDRAFADKRLDRVRRVERVS